MSEIETAAVEWAQARQACIDTALKGEDMGACVNRLASAECNLRDAVSPPRAAVDAVTRQWGAEVGERERIEQLSRAQAQIDRGLRPIIERVRALAIFGRHA